MAMAVLANAALLGQPMTTCRTTGARRPVVLGKLSFPVEPGQATSGTQDTWFGRKEKGSVDFTDGL
jgi:hypothetical protein